MKDKLDTDILHQDGEFRLFRMSETQSYLAHRCSLYPGAAKTIWWFLPNQKYCLTCGIVPSNEILGIYILHNWDRIQAAK